MKNILLVGLVFCFALSPSSFAAKRRPASAANKPLADRLGGYQAITAVVDEFVGNIAKDERINKFFAKTDITHLKKELTEQICAAGGGYVDKKHTKKCTYTGKDMKTAHAGMGVGEGDFNALLEDLVKALDKFKVPEKEKGELLAALGPMKKDIVEPATTTTKQ